MKHQQQPQLNTVCVYVYTATSPCPHWSVCTEASSFKLHVLTELVNHLSLPQAAQAQRRRTDTAGYRSQCHQRCPRTIPCGCVCRCPPWIAVPCASLPPWRLSAIDWCYLSLKQSSSPNCISTLSELNLQDQSDTGRLSNVCVNIATLYMSVDCSCMLYVHQVTTCEP